VILINTSSRFAVLPVNKILLPKDTSKVKHAGELTTDVHMLLISENEDKSILPATKNVTHGVFVLAV